MTLVEAAKLVGSTVLCNVGRGLTVPVEILDVRTAFGRVDVKITPVGGKGIDWLSKDNLEIEPAEPAPAAN